MDGVSGADRDDAGPDATGDDAARARGELVASMSHVLRTPLNSILGFAKLMQHGRAGPVSEQQREYLGDIVNSANHLLALINDVIELSKLDARRLVFTPQELDVPQVVGEVVVILAAAAATRQNRVAIDVAGDCTGIYLDPARLKQVLFSYLSHTIEAGQGGQVTVRVRRPNRAGLRFEVEGPGLAVSSERMAQLFAAGDRSGFPLVLARRLVEAQGGQAGFVAASAPGARALLFAELPSAAAPAGVSGGPS